MAPGAVPLLGHALPLFRDPIGFLTSLPTHGDLLRLRLGVIDAVAVCSPELTRQVLRDDRTFDKGGVIWDRARESAGDGVGTCPHRMHRRQRRLLQPTFHAARLPGYAHAMTEQIDQVVASWQDGEILDLRNAMSTITARSLLATIVTDTLPLTVLDQAIADITVILVGAFRRAFIPPALDCLPTPGNRRYRRATARARHAMALAIAERRASGRDNNDLLSAMLAAHDPAGYGSEQALSDTEIIDNLVSFLMAGVETTANTLAWALHLLTQYPDVEAGLHREVDTVLAGRAATFEDLPTLPMTGRIVNETLRLRTPPWMFTRITTDAIQLDRYTIPASMNVIISPLAIHNRPDLFPDPARFDPDRWLPERGDSISRTAFLPFGAGARQCIGEQFALIEAVLALATIAARWRFHPLPGERVRPSRSITLYPRGLRMRVAARSRHALTTPT